MLLSTGTLRASRWDGVWVPGVLGGVKKGLMRPGRSSWEEEEERRLRCEGIAEAWWWLLAWRSRSEMSWETGRGRGE
jgi:hypothetical protein